MLPTELSLLKYRPWLSAAMPWFLFYQKILCKLSQASDLPTFIRLNVAVPDEKIQCHHCTVGFEVSGSNLFFHLYKRNPLQLTCVVKE